MRADNDTIAAVATAPGRGGIGVVRVSGVRVREVMQAILGRSLVPRVAAAAAFLDGTGAAIDHGIGLFFAAPRSYTGEDVLELQGHGAPVVQNMLLRRCLELGCRLAEPGEFTRRAFLDGKLDLAQAESVADLIEAASERAARAALRSLEGAFSREVLALRDQLVELRALIEAALDFPEEDIDIVREAGVRARLSGVRGRLEETLRRGRQGARLRTGFSIVIAGRPNVGKSSLLNALAGEEAAIVTAVPGTTRDAIARSIIVEGMAVNVVDTAGLRETRDEVEVIGIERTRREIARADLVLHVVEAAGVNPDDAAVAAEIPAGAAVLLVYNKVDATGLAPHAQADAVWVSARTGAGLDLLRAELIRRGGLEGAAEDVSMARERHIEALEAALASVKSALAHGDAASPSLELVAEELREAQRCLNTITGEFGADDLLGEIFGRFCIGK